MSITKEDRLDEILYWEGIVWGPGSLLLTPPLPSRSQDFRVEYRTPKAGFVQCLVWVKRPAIKSQLKEKA